eukprot:859838-Prymnesium_polylepis.1
MEPRKSRLTPSRWRISAESSSAILGRGGAGRVGVGAISGWDACAILGSGCVPYQGRARVPNEQVR